MKKIIPFFVLGILCSCEIQYDVSTRLVIEGQVKDRFGTPIENNLIEVWVYNSYDTDFIGYSNTNLNGNFQIVIPEPTNENNFAVKIKGNSEFREKEYANILQSDFINYALNIGDITIIQNNDISNLRITLNQINPENNIITIELTGIIVDDTIWVNPLENVYSDPYYFDNYYKRVAKNQSLNLFYEVRNSTTGETDSFNEIITIESDDISAYSINY